MLARPAGAPDGPERAAEASGFAGELQVLPALYAGGPEAYLAALAGLEAAVTSVMLVGHNPDLEEVLLELTGVEESLPTAALAHVSLPIQDWAELATEVEGRLVQLWTPRGLE